MCCGLHLDPFLVPFDALLFPLSTSCGLEFGSFSFLSALFGLSLASLLGLFWLHFLTSHHFVALYRYFDFPFSLPPKWVDRR